MDDRTIRPDADGEGATPEVKAPVDPTWGWPQPFWRALAGRRPPGPFSGRVWHSPLRGPWLTSIFAVVLLVGLPIVIVTGLLSYVAYQPQFPGNGFPADTGWLHLPLFSWPTHPSWLYRLNQGLHVAIGLALIPVVLAKLWSVIPKLFTWPAVRSFAQAAERLSLLLLVGGVLFEMVTGVLNIQYDYVFGFDFYTAHYYGAWVFLAAFVAHIALRLPTMVHSLRSRNLREELRTPVGRTRPEPPDEYGLVALEPRPATMSRRGLLGLVGGGALTITALTIGATAGNPIRTTALLSARGRVNGTGGNRFPVNRTAAASGVSPGETGPSWQLMLRGPQAVALTRNQLLAMPQHTAELPIACVEGWSSTQTWTGVRLADLAALAGADAAHSATVRSLERSGAFNKATLNRGQVFDRDSMLALRVNGDDLSPDHGFPARVIVPAAPGVHNTKWVREIFFEGL